MSNAAKPLALSRSYPSYFPAPAYEECETQRVNDLFPIEIYRQLDWMKNLELGDYKIGGSAAL
ncbi:MAG TPA: hypothetical protein VFU89_03545, partial [Rhabdochlamydiaceae bacterium]|nr:hypothetical protein [Rhabdochlamydiaceae bacterium]